MIETKRRIEAEEPPFDDPPYDESGEPAYLDEWLQADVELELVGRATVSMLSEALKQFFVASEKRLWGELPCGDAFKAEFRNGFLSGYMTCFGAALGFDPKDCPADLGVVEQVVLARNLTQHQGDLVMTSVTHDARTRQKFPRPFFMRGDEPLVDDDRISFLAPALHVSRGKLFEALGHVETLAQWLQEQIEARRFRR